MGDEVVLAAFDGYWGGWDGKHVKDVYMKKVPEFASRRQMVEKGDATIISHISPEDNKALSANKDVVVAPVDSFQNLITFFNTAKPPLDNAKLRQALSYAFPYGDVVEHALGGEARQGRGIIPHGLWGHGSDVYQYSYDLEKARGLLAEAGYPDGGLELVVTYMSGEEGEKRSLELYQSELAKLNVKLELRAMPWESQWDMAKNPDPSKIQDLFTMYWWPDVASPYSWLLNLFHSEGETLYNMSYYNNPEYDALIDDANVLAGTDRAAAERMFIDSQKILMDEAVAIPMFDMKNTLVHRANFKGFVDNPAYPNVVFFYDTYFE
jgi:peptide/nickel transport system substrate-binding protein